MTDFSKEQARELCLIHNWSALMAYAQDWRTCEPLNYLSHYYLGISLYELGLNSSAIEAYEKSIALNSQDASVWDNLAIAIGKMRGFKDAEPIHKIAIQTDPTHANSRLNYGTLLGQHGRSREAVVVLMAAHALARDRIDILGTLIKALDDESNYSAIRDLLPTCKALDPSKALELENYLRSRGV